MYDLVIRGGDVVTAQATFCADIGVRDGRVTAVGIDLAPGDDELDARGRWVLPGLVDLHVHFRQPGLTHKEDFDSGTRAAAAGGVTTVFDMPNVVPPTASGPLFEAKRDEVAPMAHVDFCLYGVVTQDNENELAGMFDAGAIGLKLFMGETTGYIRCPDDGVIYSALRAAAAHDRVIGVHAENDHVLQRLAGELQAAGRDDPAAHLLARPGWIEGEAVARAATLARAASARLHVHHLSSRSGVESLMSARRAGTAISAEVLVAHLLLDARAYDEHGNLAKLNPPIRERADVEALWEAVRRGWIECIATDHAPHTIAEQATDSVWAAPGGFIGVETMLPLLLTEVVAGRLTLQKVVSLTSEMPARLHRLHPRKGSLSVGADADIVVAERCAPYRLDQRTLHSKHPVTPFHGWELHARAVATYLRGNCVARDGDVLGPPTGRFVTRAERPVPATSAAS